MPNPEAAVLLDELPLGPVDLASAPAESLRRLFETFRLEVRHEAATHRAYVRAWISEGSLSAAVAEAGNVIRVDFGGKDHATRCADVRRAPGSL